MPVFLITELDYTDINFRIFSAPLNTLLQGTVCQPRTPRQPPFQRFSAVSAPIIPAIPQKSTPYNYLNDYSTESLSDESLSSGYPEQKVFGYSAPQSTQLPTTPKAFVYNQHNGVSLKTETPAFYNFYPQHSNNNNNYYRPNNANYQKKNSWGTHQFYY